MIITPKSHVPQPTNPASPPSDKKTMRMTAMVVYVLLIALGLGTGYLMTRNTKITNTQPNESSNMVKTDKVEGVSDTKNFKDSAEGLMEKGGINGEGTHKLIRDGGPSQTAYLVSSVIDLDTYVGKKVKVWGETFAAKKASWLMDVGKVEILE
ncbi:MAG: hypothetical protein Q8L37_00990 [Candidatus Gottesmanbacteria bacterium]|nr:hypothetical protein [Candidatus Gottesmanbacteria bacterium]